MPERDLKQFGLVGWSMASLTNGEHCGIDETEDRCRHDSQGKSALPLHISVMTMVQGWLVSQIEMKMSKSARGGLIEGEG